MQIYSVELLCLQCIVLKGAVVGDATATYPGTPRGILIPDMILHLHDAKVQRMNEENKLTH